MTLEQTLKTLKAAFSSKAEQAEAMSKEIAELKAKNETLSAEYAGVVEKFEAAAAVISERDAAIAKAEELGKALVVAEAQKAQAVSQIEDAAVVGAKIAASVGVAPVEISMGEIAAQVKEPSEIWEEYLSMKDPSAKLAFYNKNRAQIVAHLGIK